MRIVLDAMGGDHAPQVTVEGGVWAAREYSVQVAMVGNQELLEIELAKHDTSRLSLPVIHASQVLEMEDDPASAAKSKKDSSMVVGMDVVKRGEADAFYSAGNSGGVMAVALFRLGRIPGAKRPALSAAYPTTAGFCVVLDVGANTDCRPDWLLQFGIMGAAYAERVLGIKEPRVGIVSNGEEEGKGSILVKDAYALLKGSHLNFIGNVEGKDIPMGLADVVVTDGLTGNVIIKLSEGLSKFLFGIVRDEIKSSPLTTLGGMLARPAFASARKVLDYTEVGGVPLLGVNGVVIVGHGRSNATAIKNGIGAAKRAVEGGMLEGIRAGLSQVNH
ncbi:MAG: phosphate acyltransferase PlsX [Anaerolineae bacterium]|nr:phosphate acyltransferase PlsX [Anaerolineae bacterium]NIN93884.1 phosphate acyltransferase PlsX [Anaerolineae bacterium]NIQ76917.1 phosphate acyltransferase PlsX [Anaerolineae bacterium]